MQTLEDHSNPVQALNVDSLKVDLVVIQNTCSEKEDSNSETASSKSVKESSLNSKTKVLSKEDLKGTRIEHGFKRAFMSLIGQYNATFISMMLLNVDQLQKQLDKDDFQEDGSMAAFWADVDAESKVDAGKALDADLVDTKSIRTDSIVQDESIRSGHDTDADDADIRPIYNEELMAEYPEQHQVKSPMLDLSLDNQTIDYSKQSLEYENILLKKTVAQFQKDFSRMEAHCIALELKYQNQALKSGQHGQILNETSNKAKTKKEIDGLETMNIELEHSMAKLHSFSPNKTSVVYEKTSPRYDLRWKPTGRIFKSVGLRWIPTGKLFDSYTSKDDSEPTHGSNVDIPNIHESNQTLDLSAGTSIYVQKEQCFDLSTELESLFGPLFDVYLNEENQVVLKSSAVTTADASDKRQQQPDLTSSTSTLAITVTANENFDL
ncbi:hypothetical protein Tco_0116986 [Tanacetum coccineum]